MHCISNRQKPADFKVLSFSNTDFYTRKEINEMIQEHARYNREHGYLDHLD